MRAHQAEFHVATMARVLGVSSSGFYAWLRRRRSARSLSDDDLLRQVREIHQRSRGTYGAPRIHAELVESGVCVGRRRIARLMREAGLAGGLAPPAAIRRPARRRTWSTAGSRPMLPIASGWRTSPTSRPLGASCTWRSSSTPSVAGSWAGR